MNFSKDAPNNVLVKIDFIMLSIDNITGLVTMDENNKL